MDDLLPTEEEIEWTVKRLQNHRSGGPLGMRDDYLKGWLAAASKKEKEEAATGEETTENNRGGGSMDYTSTEASNWEMVVELVQKAFEEGRLAEEAMWHAVVLITKGKKDYRGIFLVVVMWKLVAAILNCRLTAYITFHDFLHRFWAIN